VSGRSVIRSTIARIVRPAFVALDHRLELLAARLERHTTNLSLDQRTEIARIDERLTLDVAVMSEHLVGIERIARRATSGAGSPPAGRLVIALPGEPLAIPDGANGAAVAAYAANGDGTWSPVAGADTSTLRVLHLPQPSAE
jgi:hypothetical protein